MQMRHEYHLEFKLASDANLEMYFFSSIKHRWIFKYKFMSPEKRELGEEPKLINDITLKVNYDRGVSQNCELSMNIIRPDKRGKESIYGVDVSRDSHLFAEFAYEKQGELFRLKTFDVGHGIKELDSLGGGLIKSVDFPFPIPDRIKNEFGKYKVPFLKSSGEETFFEFPENYHREKAN